MYDAIVLSDLHLGSELCQTDLLKAFLEKLQPTRRLILNGDVLEDTETRLKKAHWRILSQFRKLSDETELVWVKGNHDAVAESVAHLIGADFLDEYRFSSGGAEFLCVHGDRWDDFITDHPVLTRLADWAYLLLKKFSHEWAVSVKKSSKAFLRCADEVRSAAVRYADKHAADVIFCGHTHHAESYRGYVNSGCWTEPACHYATVADGKVCLVQY